LKSSPFQSLSKLSPHLLRIGQLSKKDGDNVSLDIWVRINYILTIRISDELNVKHFDCRFRYVFFFCFGQILPIVDLIIEDEVHIAFTKGLNASNDYSKIKITTKQPEIFKSTEAIVTDNEITLNWLSNSNCMLASHRIISRANFHHFRSSSSLVLFYSSPILKTGLVALVPSSSYSRTIKYDRKQ